MRSGLGAEDRRTARWIIRRYYSSVSIRRKRGNSASFGLALDNRWGLVTKLNLSHPEGRDPGYFAGICPGLVHRVEVSVHLRGWAQACFGAGGRGGGGLAEGDP